MTGRPVAPVIPGASPGRRRQAILARRPMPLASPTGRPDVVYGFGRIDASGRVADRVTIAALGWRGGDRLTLTAEAGVMIARRDPGGMDMLAAYSFTGGGPSTASARPGPRRRRGTAMTAAIPAASRQAVVEAALVLLEQMGGERTARTVTGSSTSGAPAAWMSPPRRSSIG